MKKKNPQPGTVELSISDLEKVIHGEGAAKKKKAKVKRGKSAKKRPPRVPKKAENKTTGHLKIAQIIDNRYQVEKELGMGAMGRVYLVKHLRLGKAFALKVVNPDLATRPEYVARFEREAHACSRLDHPNCISVTDFGHEADGTLYLVMEYVDGVALSDIAKDTPAPLAEALEYTRQILVGLEHAHSMGLIHRDIKLENVIKCHRKNNEILLKILDFGMAKPVLDDEDSESITQRKTVLGTPQYLAPEQINGGDMDERSDLYSVGICLYRMITGKIVFHGHTLFDTLAVKVQHPAPTLQDATLIEYPKALEKLIKKALRRRPEHRFQSAHEMLEALAKVRERIDGMAEEEESNPRSSSWPISALVSRFPAATSRIPAAISRIPAAISRIPATISRIPAVAEQLNKKNKKWAIVGGTAGLIALLVLGALFIGFSSAEEPHLPPKNQPREGANWESLNAPVPAPAEDEQKTAAAEEAAEEAGEEAGEEATAAEEVGKEATAEPQAELEEQRGPTDQAIIDPILLEAKILIERNRCRAARGKLESNTEHFGSQAARGYFLLGWASMCMGRPYDALTHYTKAIELDDHYRNDMMIAKHAKSMLSVKRVRKYALTFMKEVQGEAAMPLLIQIAGHHKNPDLRHQALAYVRKHGLIEHVDLAASLDWDLNQTDNCGKKRRIVKKLRKLGTQKAKQVLIRSRDAYRRKGLFRKEYDHECVRKDIIKALDRMGNKK